MVLRGFDESRAPRFVWHLSYAYRPAETVMLDQKIATAKF